MNQQNQEYDFSIDFVEGTELPEGKSVEGTIRSVDYVTRNDGTVAVLINVSVKGYLNFEPASYSDIKNKESRGYTLFNNLLNKLGYKKENGKVSDFLKGKKVMVRRTSPKSEDYSGFNTSIFAKNTAAATASEEEVIDF